VVSQPPDPRVQRVARLLETLVRVKGVSFRHLERQLGASVGTARRIFTGAIAFKLSHIFDILAVLDVPPSLFFRMAFEDAAPPQALDEAEVLLAKAQKITQPPLSLGTDLEPVPDESFLRLVEVALQQLGVIPAKPQKEKRQAPANTRSKATAHRPQPTRRQTGADKKSRAKRP
jgi:transcriptional regulator with XRE-family HTH domain